MNLSKDAKCINLYFKSIGDGIKQSAEDIEKTVVSDIHAVSELSFGRIMSTIIKKIKDAPDLAYDYIHRIIKQKWAQYVNHIMIALSMSTCCLCMPYILCIIIIITLFEMLNKTANNNDSSDDPLSVSGAPK
jgi:hypothetical protein